MIITSPNVIDPPETPGVTPAKAIFLAGGITNCPDWQQPVAERLYEMTNLIIFNPRRLNWNMENSEVESKKQIIWEHNQLQRAQIILFWFPEETLCPITLLELGKYLVSDKKLIIGTHPNYQRRLDVLVQTELVRREQDVYDNIDDMISEFIADYRAGMYS